MHLLFGRGDGNQSRSRYIPTWRFASRTSDREFYRIFQNSHVAPVGRECKHRRQRATLHRAFREYCPVQHPKGDIASFPRRGKSLFNNSAVYDLVKGIPAFWAVTNLRCPLSEVFLFQRHSYGTAKAEHSEVTRTQAPRNYHLL